MSWGGSRGKEAAAGAWCGAPRLVPGGGGAGGSCWCGFPAWRWERASEPCEQPAFLRTPKQAQTAFRPRFGLQLSGSWRNPGSLTG